MFLQMKTEPISGFLNVSDSEVSKEFERCVDLSPAILWISDADGSCTYLSRQWYSYTGQPQGTGLGFGWLDAVSPDDLEQVAITYHEAVKTHKPFTIDYRIRTADGNDRWAIDAGNPRFDHAGNFLGYVGTVFDMHDHKLASLALEESTARYKLLFDNSPLPKWVIDAETLQFIDVNETAIETYGYTREEFLSMKLQDLWPPEDTDRFERMVDEQIATDSHRSRLLFKHKKKNGVVIPVEVSAHNIRLNGRTARMAAVVDISDRVRAEEHQEELLNSLRIAKDEAERANTLKSMFLANMSHEIRTPLGAMIGFADLLRDPDISARERASYIDILIRNGEQLSIVINDILDLSKVEAGHMKLEVIPADPNTLVTDVLSLLRMKAKEKDLLLEYSPGSSVPSRIGSDPVRVRQILVNLISNAIKFTQTGGVKVTSFYSERAEGNHEMGFDISDTGIGVDPEHAQHIFDMFVQADGSMTRRFGGTGLGLALSRKLARALGGDVTLLQTSSGKGSTFRFTFKDQPLLKSDIVQNTERESQETKAKSPSENALAGIRVLVVDDAADNRQLIDCYLSKQGAIIESAENGLDGLQKALKSDFDVVLMDIQMPVMDGYTATQMLRERGYYRPIVALTAHAMTEVRKKCFNIGCSDHLTKPIDPSELVSTVLKHAHP